MLGNLGIRQDRLFRLGGRQVGQCDETGAELFVAGAGGMMASSPGPFAARLTGEEPVARLSADPEVECVAKTGGEAPRLPH